jgi:hypothetical protein
MSKRTTPTAIENANDLSELATIVVDKRGGKRSGAKKGRRNRHYEKQLIRNALSQGKLYSAANQVPENDPSY